MKIHSVEDLGEVPGHGEKFRVVYEDGSKRFITKGEYKRLLAQFKDQRACREQANGPQERGL